MICNLSTGLEDCFNTNIILLPFLLTANWIFWELAKYDDFIVESYLNNTFGVHSSLENIGRFKDSIKQYNIINSNLGNYPDFELYPLNRLNGLRGVEDHYLILY